MVDPEVLVELRFDRGSEDVYEKSVNSLSALDVERSTPARDPTVVAALTVAAAAVSLTIELVKLARELRAAGKEKGVQVVKIDQDNKERTLDLLSASESQIDNFISN